MSSTSMSTPRTIYTKRPATLGQPWTISPGHSTPSGGNRSLVLSHNSLLHTAESLVPHMLMEIQQRGLRAVTVGECLGDPEENWYWTA